MAVPIIVLQTIAANLGSMVTPIGNPQNLYLYSQSGLTPGDFIVLMLPYAGISATIFIIAILCMKNKEIQITSIEETASAGHLPKKAIAVYLVLFASCVCAVARLLPW